MTGASATPTGPAPQGAEPVPVSGKAASPLRGWITHDGGECPINRDTIVQFKFANGNESEREYRAGNFIWRKRGWAFDIAAYRIVGGNQDDQGSTWTPVSGGY